MPFCTPILCLRPAGSSFRRKNLKKSQSPIQHPKQESNRRFQRVKGYNFIREVVPNNQPVNSSTNYDMSVLHDDEIDDTQVALSHRQSKKIPRWARKSQLQLAIINQVYYNEKQPEEIFGSVQLNLVDEMIDSIELWNRNISLPFCYATLPPNFV